MNVIVDKEHYKIKILDNNSIVLLELGFVGDEFVFLFYTSDPIQIMQSECEVFYNYLNNIMKNNYVFADKFCMKEDNKIIWLSDQYGDLENESETDKIDRLIIKKERNEFILTCYNPYFEKNKIKKSWITIGFSPAGCGKFSRNTLSELSFQDDIILEFQNILNSKTTKLIKSRNEI